MTLLERRESSFEIWARFQCSRVQFSNSSRTCVGGGPFKLRAVRGRSKRCGHSTDPSIMRLHSISSRIAIRRRGTMRNPNCRASSRSLGAHPYPFHLRARQWISRRCNRTLRTHTNGNNKCLPSDITVGLDVRRGEWTNSTGSAKSILFSRPWERWPTRGRRRRRERHSQFGLHLPLPFERRSIWSNASPRRALIQYWRMRRGRWLA